jgi:hypothetical protein
MTAKSSTPTEPQSGPAKLATNGSGGKYKTDAHMIAAVNAEHALVLVNGKLSVMWLKKMDGGVPVLSSINDVKQYWKKGQRGKVNAIDVWMRSYARREYDGMVFKPGAADTGRNFNLWQGWAVLADPCGTCGLFLEHIRDVLCDGDEDLFDYVIQWLANMIQTPQDKPGTALSFQGGQGSGKGAFKRYIASILGPHLLQLEGSEQLLGRFNDALAAKLMVFVDEMFWLGAKAGIERVKSFITEDEITVERKYVSAFTIKNDARFVFATNRDHAAPAEADDRRFVPLNVSGAYIGKQRYWDHLEAERQGGGPAALLHYLQNVRLTRNLRLTPKTAALAVQKMLSLDDVGAFVHALLLSPNHQLRSGYDRDAAVRPTLNFGEITTPQTIHGFYLDHCKRHQKHYPASHIAFAIALHKYITIDNREARRDEIKAYGLEGIRPRIYTMPTLAEGRAQFAEAFGQPIAWPDDAPTVSPAADVDEYPRVVSVDQFD